MSIDYNMRYKQYKATDLAEFKLDEIEKVSRFFPRLSLLIVMLIFFFIGIMFVPWIQTSSGSGQVTALRPEDRVQQIVATVTGRVSKWYVRDGSVVKKGDRIAEIVDIDPQLLYRLQVTVSSMQDRLTATIEATQLAQSNFTRQQKLYQSGLASKREFELAQISYQKAVADQQYYKLQLIQAQSSLASQTSQLIKAERTGRVVNTLASSGSKVVKLGEVLATFLPETNNIAVEIYINGNDVPLVYPGRKARLVFDGWPSIQFSGWPSVSVSTFGGIVKVVDYVASSNGMFRILIEPDPNDLPWPSKNFLRMGASAQGYIQFSRVRLGYELWRQLNGFPLAINNKNNSATLNSNAVANATYNSNGGKNGQEAKNY